MLGKGTGGIVGSLSIEGVIDNCYNEGNISGSLMVGGIAGHLGGIIKNCYNNGNLTNNETQNYYAGTGGIAGGSISTESNLIYNCYNNENVKIVGKNIGGIIGRVISRGQGIERISLINCCNLSIKLNASDILSFGGIIGNAYNISRESKLYLKLINCYSYTEYEKERHISIWRNSWIY